MRNNTQALFFFRLASNSRIHPIPINEASSISENGKSSTRNAGPDGYYIPKELWYLFIQNIRGKGLIDSDTVEPSTQKIVRTPLLFPPNALLLGKQNSILT